MPIYEYQCDQCGKIQEELQKISDKPLTACTHCAGKLHRLISHSAFHLKGTGWYVTDYAGKKQGDTAKTDDSAPAKKETTGASTAAKADNANSTAE